MEDKKLTSAQKARRRYEDKNREERKQLRVQFTTSLSRQTYERITEFLEKYNISKVDLIFAGFDTLLEKYENPNQKQ